MTKVLRGSGGMSRISSASNPTVRIDPSANPLSKMSVSASETVKTRIYRSELSRSESEANATVPMAKRDPMADPVVGWLVVTDGPGRGAALPLGYGKNSIGRAETERVPLAFGDDEVSRVEHAVLTYDPRSRKFYLQSGGTNLTYIEGRDEPVLTAMVLTGGEELLVGKTRLTFVPFCGPHFDWHSAPSSAGGGDAGSDTAEKGE